MTGSLAVSVMPLETRRLTIVRLATEAERRGYDAFFLPEAWAYDTTVLLADVAARTERIGLGTGILGVWGRSPGTLAWRRPRSTSVSGRRFTLGLGARTKQLTEGLHDVPFSAPPEADAARDHPILLLPPNLEPAQIVRRPALRRRPCPPPT